ncbi:MAG: phosphoribosylglycinamide formyltransferase [Chlorobi bacterium]|nr:phosphoribosylglycinamide formyltransferase [Chlorobiota bacterium]
MSKIAIFASGSGTNAENIIKYFKNYSLVEISIVLSNKKDALVLKRAKNLNTETIAFNKKQFNETNEIVDLLINKKIDLIVLAGFLWLIPDNLIQQFPNKIINIHPALLPKYGGKGMYGKFVHESVLKNKEKESGITIHYVNSKYDEGKIVFQSKVIIEPNDNAGSLAKKIHQLEYKYYPKVIEGLLIPKKF